MPKFILHIGTHKTGTTALQRFMAHNQAQLLDRGIAYPLIDSGQGVANQHSDLAFAIREAPDKARLICETMVTDIQRQGVEQLILSGEEFCYMRDKHMDLVQEIFPIPPSEIIIYFRNIYDYLLASIIERAKRGRAFMRPRNFFANTAFTLNYNALITRWQSTFPDAHITIRNYEKEKSNLLRNFARPFGIEDLIDNTNTDKERESSNPSPTLAFAMDMFLSESVASLDEYRQYAQTQNKAEFFAAGRTEAELSFADLIIFECSAHHNLNINAMRKGQLAEHRDSLFNRPMARR